MVIGKHSGSNSIKAKFREYGINLSEEDAQEILSRCRQMAIDKKRSLFDKEISCIHQDLMKEKALDNYVEEYL